jgi:curved DNA-binding protein CbpA
VSVTAYRASDHYRVLGVDPRADGAAIHRAYRALARRFHPDVTGDDSTMKIVNVAWDVLRDPRRRAEYDQERTPGSSTIVPPAPSTSAADHVGPAPGKPSGPVLTYGRYSGWSLGEIARIDAGYLEWLRHAPGYRWLRDDIDAVLREVAPTPPPPQRPQSRGGFARFASALRG